MPVIDHNQQSKLAKQLKLEAARLGFDACGIAQARQLDDEAKRLEVWLANGQHASMAYMTRNFEKRVDPRKLVPGAKRVVTVLYSYWQGGAHAEGAGKISRYAWGDDYHQVMKERLYELYSWLEGEVKTLSGRVFVDSAPVMDKVWAQRSGLGWIAKNTNLINPRIGSWFFIGTLIIDVPLTCDDPATYDHCGSCTRCIDACPTDAIYQPYVVDSNRCISYWTIEHRGDSLPEEIMSQQEDWIFGCDICQDVCPWNKFSRQTKDSRFLPREGIQDTPLEEWEELDLEAFRKRFRGSAVKRAKYEGFKRNVRAAKRSRVLRRD
ncbi:MAG: tRNA epoxyqueuosine(34) reductase QueG [Rhodothermaceae bacterium]|nr:tRNA epoxyqueuosine(34) reductase QueG [Rhodothermaceae bacterium]MYG68545.1 tRNA epoxyqueuosine(34) reductase QueG [Rhodothermaceae bacterium]MYJ44167.1 tRNA epoxyqueuosine(34) reductase QueG [Rhodothermaceae bacterium]